MKILVGLGNPGTEYERHRHNVGFMAADAIASHYDAPAWRRRFQGLATEIEVAHTKCLLLKPTTYMNESGRAVSEAMRFYKISPADVIVFHDELDLEPGKIRVKSGGGHAGHNGLRSISAHIGNDFARLRIGIGHPGSREVVVHYVLHDFSRADREWLETLLPAIAQALPLLIAGQDAKFMNEVVRAYRPGPAKAGKDTAPERQAKAAPAKPKSEAQLANVAADAPPAQTSLGAKLRAWLNRA